MKIGRYEVLDEIGHGAMGTVWRARDPLIERTVAIKTVAIAQLRQEGAERRPAILQMAEALAFAHEHGGIHRDKTRQCCCNRPQRSYQPRKMRAQQTILLRLNPMPT